MLSEHLNMVFCVIMVGMVTMEEMFEISFAPVDFTTKTN